MTLKRALIPMFLIAALAATLPMALAAPADSTVTLSDVHLCCDSCVKSVATATTPIKGVTAVADKSKGTIVLTAADKDTLQKAVNALTAAGYFGKSSDDAVKVDGDTGAKDGKVKTLTVEGIHLCCNSCVTAMRGVIGKVDGITGNDVKAKAASITLTGDFEPKAFFAELQKSGLTGHVKQ